MGASSRGRAIAALFAIAMAAASVAPASALSRTVPDPQTPPASADVSSVRYVDGTRTALARVHVRRLPRAGSVLVRIGPAGGTSGYVARVSRSASRKVTTVLIHVTAGGRTLEECAIGASWSRGEDVVQVVVPQSCLDFGRYLVRLQFQAVFTAGAHSDRAPARVVGRGDSPGCVTPAEFDTLRVGRRMDAVTATFDTPGVAETSDPGTLSRSYRGCDGGSTYLVQYGSSSHTVETWSVLGPPPTA